MRPGPNGHGLSRKAILSELDHSLQRLGTDYVDLYHIHRYDYETPLEETLEALNDVVRAGKVRYLGASSMYAWQFMKAISIQRARGWAQFISMQNYYNLLYREEEREMLPLCASEGIGVIPWSPLARGRLARPWQEQPANRPRQNRRLRREAVRKDRRHRQARNRSRKRDRPRTQSPTLPNRPGLAAPQTRHHRPHHRRHQTPSPRRRRSRHQHKALHRRNHPPRTTLSTPSPIGSLLLAALQTAEKVFLLRRSVL